MEGFQRLKPRLVISKVKTYGEIHALRQECGLCPIFVSFPGIHLRIQEKNCRKNLTQGSQKVPVARDSVCRHGHHLTGSHDNFANPGLHWDAL